MGELTASIAHEVNQPLAALLTNAETAVRWLARQPPNLEKAKPLIDRIIGDGKRAADIVSRIRDFSKKAPARKEDLEINEAILEIMGLTRAAMSEHGVSSKMRLSDGLPHISGDRVQLQQVILNLIMNAIEAMSEVSEGSRELLISTSEAESGGVLVTVSDTGPGLPQTNPERIFEAFYTTKSSGLGMGLSICRSIVEAHGGGLWAAPNEPRGAVFCMNLPIGEGRFFPKAFFNFFEIGFDFWPSEQTLGGIALFQERPQFRRYPVSRFGPRLPAPREPGLAQRVFESYALSRKASLVQLRVH